MLQKSLTAILILLLARFLDKISAQYLYFLSLEHGLLNTDGLLILNVSPFYTLKGFWNLFWWALFIISSLILIFRNIPSIPIRLMTESLSDDDNDDNDTKTKTKSSKRKRPVRASRHYKSRRYDA